MNLKEIRKNKKLTQNEAAEILKVSLRSFETLTTKVIRFLNTK